MTNLDDKINASLQKNFGEWVFKNLSPDQTAEFNKNMQAFMNDVFAATTEDSAEHHNELYDKSHIAGMNAPLVFSSIVNILYPEEHLSRNEYIDSLDDRRDFLLRCEYGDLQKKLDFAMSGAMRWRFSEEAPQWSKMKITTRDYRV